MRSPHHVNPLEIVEVAVGVVDAAWTAVERSREHAQHHSMATTWEDCVKLESELIQEKSENHRLKASLDELLKALHDAKTRDQGSQANGINTFSQTYEDGYPVDLYERLQQKVESPIFLERLKGMQEVESKQASGVTAKDSDEATLEKKDCSSWVVVPKLVDTDGKGEVDGLDEDGFIMISQDNVIEGLAAFVAKLVVSNPSAKAMSPSQLQEVISVSFAKLEQEGKLKKLWSTAKFVHSSVYWTTTIATTALGLYNSPFVVRGIFKVLTISSQLVIKAFT